MYTLGRGCCYFTLWNADHFQVYRCVDYSNLPWHVTLVSFNRIHWMGRNVVQWCWVALGNRSDWAGSQNPFVVFWTPVALYWSAVVSFLDDVSSSLDKGKEPSILVAGLHMSCFSVIVLASEAALSTLQVLQKHRLLVKVGGNADMSARNKYAKHRKIHHANGMKAIDELHKPAWIVWMCHSWWCIPWAAVLFTCRATVHLALRLIPTMHAWLLIRSMSVWICCHILRGTSAVAARHTNHPPILLLSWWTLFEKLKSISFCPLKSIKRLTEPNVQSYP